MFPRHVSDVLIGQRLEDSPLEPVARDRKLLGAAPPRASGPPVPADQVMGWVPARGQSFLLQASRLVMKASPRESV